MPVFAFMGSSLLRQDDSYTFDVINRTLESVVPKLVKVRVIIFSSTLHVHACNTCSSERILHSYYIF